MRPLPQGGNRVPASLVVHAGRLWGPLGESVGEGAEGQMHLGLLASFGAAAPDKTHFGLW